MALETFLLDAVQDRIAPMLREVSAQFPNRVTQVIPYWTDKAEPPAWLVYNAPQSRQSYSSAASASVTIQTYTLALRLNYAPASSGFDGVKEQFVGYQLIPTVMNYFTARRGLCYTAAQVVADGLEPSKTAIALASPFGLFPDTPNVVGVEFNLILGFRQSVSSIYNNP